MSSNVYGIDLGTNNLKVFCKSSGKNQILHWDSKEFTTCSIKKILLLSRILFSTAMQDMLTERTFPSDI